jgi:hypothetical protein
MKAIKEYKPKAHSLSVGQVLSRPYKFDEARLVFSEMIDQLSLDEICALAEENARLRQELRIRDNDILSHDQVFDSIVSGTLHLILVMSVTTYKAEFITSNIDIALGISRSEAASTIFINACNEFQFLESVRKSKVEKPRRQKQAAANEELADESELNKLLTTVLEEHNDEMYASELKGVLLRLRPDFNEKNYGCASFFKLLTKLARQFGDLKVLNDNYNVTVTLTSGDSGEAIPQLNKDNWKEAFKAQIQAYKEGGFDRVNPSILKADIITSYPNFNERAIGFKRFSDVMKQLEKDGLIAIEMDEQKTMLIKLL